MKVSRRRFLLASGVITAAITSSACAAQPAAAPTVRSEQPTTKTQPPATTELKKATLRLNWLATSTQSGFYLALERGYYKEVGLDIEILEGKGTNPTVQLIAQQKDTFGWAAADGMIKAVLKGAPVKAVAGVAQKGPHAIIARGDSGIKKVEDLAGRSIAGTAGGTSEALLPALLATAKVDPAKVTIIPVDPASKVAVVLEKKADALFGYITTEPFQVKSTNPVVIQYADYGVNVLADSIMINNDWLKANGEMTRQFVAASLKGWEEATKKPEDAIEALMKHNSALKREDELEGLKVYSTLLHTKNSQGKPIGWMATQDWQESQDLLRKYDLIGETVPVETYFTNDYLPASQ